MPSPLPALILFTRFPIPGRTKTRLIPALGSLGAASLQRRLTEQTLARAAAFCQAANTELEVHYQGAGLSTMRDWLGAQVLVPQADGDLGARMQQAFSRAFAAGRPQVVIIGSDCPGLSTELLQEAFSALARHDLVLGPAMDGGYYLIGLGQTQPDLFAAMPWGSDQVLAQTIERAKSHALSIHQLAARHDIDRPADLDHLDHHPHPE